MIILITGATHTGKTKLAQNFLEKYQIPYLSIDHLKMGLIRSGKTRLTPEDDTLLTEYLWPIVREIIKTAIENEQSLIVEGCYIPFDWRKDFNKQYLQSIQYICLAMTGDYIDRHFIDIKEHESDVETRLRCNSCTPALLKKDNRMYIDGCQQNGNPITLIDDNYEQVINGVIAL